MLNNKKITVVLPAYNSEKTLRKVYEEIDLTVADNVLLVDDASSDRTVQTARDLGIRTIVHSENRGYGANQKTCYQEALSTGADVIVMLHPDYQYPPRLIPAIAGLVSSGEFDVALGSRILGGRAMRLGMPAYKYLFNRFLTAFQNLFLGCKLSEYHTGFRAYSSEVLRKVRFLGNSDGFIFDNEIIAQCIHRGFRIGEISSPGYYHRDASSISLLNSVKYGLGVFRVTFLFILHKTGMFHIRMFKNSD